MGFTTKKGKRVDSIELFEKTFLKYESDKSGYHSYEKIYSTLFNNRENVKNILEVGIHLGGSLRAWKELFINSNIIGLDNNVERFFSEPRIYSMYLDQSVESTFDQFKSAVRGTEFDLIIDDGCHYLNETILTFKKLLPLLSDKGYFVVEDIQEKFISYWEDIKKELPKNYSVNIYNMNDLRKTNLNDNIMFVVRRES